MNVDQEKELDELLQPYQMAWDQELEHLKGTPLFTEEELRKLIRNKSIADKGRTNMIHSLWHNIAAVASIALLLLVGASVWLNLSSHDSSYAENHLPDNSMSPNCPNQINSAAILSNDTISQLTSLVLDTIRIVNGAMDKIKDSLNQKLAQGGTKRESTIATPQKQRAEVDSQPSAAHTTRCPNELNNAYFFFKDTLSQMTSCIIDSIRMINNYWFPSIADTIHAFDSVRISNNIILKITDSKSQEINL